MAACGLFQARRRVSTKQFGLCFYVWIYYLLRLPGGISRRMVRTPEGTFPLTDFIGREQEYDEEKFVAAPVKKGNPHRIDVNGFRLSKTSCITWIHLHLAKKQSLTKASS